MCQKGRLSSPHLIGDNWNARGVTGDLMRALDSIPKMQDRIKGGGLLYDSRPIVNRPIGQGLVPLPW